MRNILFILFFWCAFIFGTNAQTIQIGSGTSTNGVNQSSPVNIYYRRTVCQFVYTKTELNAAGISSARDLQKFGFYVANSPIYALPGYVIKMKHVTVPDVSAALGTTGWQTVKNSFNYAPVAGGYDMLTLDAPFSWNGVDNIGIEICWSQVQPNWDPSGQIRIFNSNRGYRYSWTDAAGSSCGSTPGTRSSNKPQCQMTFDTFTMWTGTVSTDWFDNANWSANVPNSDMDATIPAGVTNMPIIGAGIAACKNIQIDPGASLDLNAVLQVNADWNNNGSLNGQGTIEFVNNNVQNQILGSSAQTFYNLTVNSNYGASVGIANINILGELRMVMGKLNTGNAITLISDSAGTASIPEIKTGCMYQLVMDDSWGDGWNGGFITVNVDAQYYGDYSAKGSSSTDTIFVSDGSTIELNYTSGSYENENSYALLDPNGTSIFSDGPTPSTTNPVFTTISSCIWFDPIVGDVTMQRYIDAGATNWRFLTSAVAGASIASFNDDFITSGFTGSDFPLWPTAANPWPSIYFYDETTVGIKDSGFVAVTNVTDPVAVGQGIWAWSGDTITGTQPFTIDMTGPANAGDISLPVTYTNTGLPDDDGWSMVGNPYPSTVDWDSPYIAKTGIDNAIYVWNPDLGQFASYALGVGANGGSRYIASSQAFWVHAVAPGATVQLTESCKTANGGAFIKQGSTCLSIVVNNNHGSDETVINFASGATNGFDGIYDAVKLTSMNPDLPSVSTMLAGEEYSINQLPRQEISIPLKVTTGTLGIHQITFDGVSNFSDAYCLLLEDLFTGNVYDLNITTTVTVFISDTTHSPRFLIKFGAEHSVVVTDVSCFGENDGAASFTKNSSDVFDVIWKDDSNNVIANHAGVIVSDSIGGLPGGTFLVESTDNTCGTTMDTVIIAEPDQITADFVSDADTVYLSWPTVNFTNHSLNANYYAWDFGDLGTSYLTSPTHQYIQSGNYTVVLSAFQSASCYADFARDVTVLDDITAIEKESSRSIEIRIHDGVLVVGGTGISSVEVRNVIGQILFSSDAGENVFNLESLNSQSLIISIVKNKQTIIKKILYIKN